MTQTIILAGCWAGAAAAQSTPGTPYSSATPIGVLDGTTGNTIQQTGCSSCGSGGLSSPSMSNGGAGGGCGENCFPGRSDGCNGCGGDSECACGFRGIVRGLYECLCCPDPCYEPHWNPLSDSAFFVDAARPKTQLKLHWDSMFDIKNPDRAEFIWAREAVKQAEPTGACTRHGFGKGPACIPRNIDIEQLGLYVEGGTDTAGFFIDTAYQEIDPEESAISRFLSTTMPPVTSPCCTTTGFTDLRVGTKSVLLDCELLQLTFQFKTYIPSGDFTKGLGTGHVSLEPSLLYNLKLSPEMYMQGQFAYWIPLGGDDLYQGNVFHCHFSLNRMLWHITSNVFLVGTAEINEWSILGGNYTGPDFLTPDNKPYAISATTSMVSVGPGVRLFICDRIDIGVGSAFALTGERWAEETVKAELRWRF